MTDSDTLPFTERAQSRRRGPRLEVLGQLHGQLVPMELPMLVRNLGAGGFGIESSVPFPVGAVQKFRFTTVAGVGVVVSAEVKHCVSMHTDDGTQRYRAGFSFVHEPGGVTVRAIELLLNAATSTLMFQ
jgi:hypothetical protein